MKSYLKTKDFFLSQEEFDLLYDSDLDMLVTHAQPKELSSYYESNDYISHSDGKTTFFEKLYQFVKDISLGHKCRLLEKHADKGGRLLDIGAGTGDFLLYAQKKQWIIDGVEPNSSARAIARKKGLKVQEELLAVDGNEYDIITLWHVLEHLPDLKSQIVKITSLLKSNGVLIIAVPNYRSYDALYYGKFWAAFDVPRHLWHFSKKSIETLFKQNHFQLITTKPMWFDSFYVSLLSEQYKSGRKNWIKAFCVGFWSNIKGVGTKEYSSHIYILKKQ